MTDSAKPSDITYAGYLALDDLLAAQHPLSDEHDEMRSVVDGIKGIKQKRQDKHSLRSYGASQASHPGETPRSLVLASRAPSPRGFLSARI